MADLLGIFSFDCGQSMRNTVDITGTVVASTQYAKTGTYALRIGTNTSATASARFSVTGSPSNPAVSLWLRHSGSFDINLGTVIRMILTTGEYIDFFWNATTHTFDAYVDGNLVAAGTIEVSVDDWFHVQIYVTVADAGTIDVLIDGHESINYSGDTQPGAAAGVQYVMIRKDIGYVSQIFVDDLIIGSGGFLGDIRGVDLRPTADTAVDDWTPSAGDNYSTIDEVSTDVATIDADYNETNADAQADEHALADFDGATYVPIGVMAWVRAKMAAATGDSIDVGIDSGGTDEVTRSALSTQWEYYYHMADDNPADSAEWEDADIDALKLRYVSVIA